MRVKAFLHLDETGNRTYNDDRWGDFGPSVSANVSRLMFRQDQTLLDSNDNEMRRAIIGL